MSLVTERKGSQLRHSTLSYVFTEDKGRAKPVLSDDYVVGLVDGEGCFYVNVPETERYTAGARVELGFYIKMQVGDRAILERVKETLGCGAVYFQKETRLNHTQCFRYTVASHRDILNVIIPFFLHHPPQCPSKRKNFELFRTVVSIVQNGGHRTREGVEKIRLLKKLMNQRTAGLA
ncbi:MAG: LAGLIDADG family homing endonuclease [Patescibacteria group bacterium]